MGGGLTEPAEIPNRRPLKSRGTGWAKLATRLLLRTGISADQVSLLGIAAALLGSWAAMAAPERPLLYLAAALGIQVRLLCNMLDGLVAVEGGRKSLYGPLFNEMPDRIEDSVLLIAFGAAAGQLWLGLLAALLAAITAYVRALGGSLGFAQDFRGPMAKPHRMAALTLAAVAALGEAWFLESRQAIGIALWIVVAGTALTVVRRTLGIAAQLRAAS
jgi:phosphatidylglycerophosphate synthase